MKIQFLLASAPSLFATEFHLSYSTMKREEKLKINLEQSPERYHPIGTC